MQSISSSRVLFCLLSLFFVQVSSVYWTIINDLFPRSERRQQQKMRVASGHVLELLNGKKTVGTQVRSPSPGYLPARVERLLRNRWGCFSSLSHRWPSAHAWHLSLLSLAKKRRKICFFLSGGRAMLRRWNGVADQPAAIHAGKDETPVQQSPIEPLLEQHSAQLDSQFRILRSGLVAHVPLPHRAAIQRRVPRPRRNRFRTSLQFPQLGAQGTHWRLCLFFEIIFTYLFIVEWCRKPWKSSNVNG